MKKLIVLTFLTCFGANALSQPVSATPAAADRANPVDTLLEEQLKAYTDPLTVDAKFFSDFARAELEKTFGTSSEDKIVYQDSFVVNGDGRWNDFTRLYYIAKVDSSLLENASNYATFYIGTDGTSSVSLVDYSGSAKSISLLFPGWLVSYKSDLSLEEMDGIIADLRAKHPNVLVEQISKILLPRLISVHAKQEQEQEQEDADGSVTLGRPKDSLSREAILDLQSFKAQIDADSRVDYQEIDSEGRNPGLQAPTIDLGPGSASAVIDLNALRSVTVDELKGGSPAVKTPSLPAPFNT